MRKLHIHHLITKLELGGAQQNTLYCVRHHNRRRFRVSLGVGPGGVLDRDARSIPSTELHFFPGLVREVSPVRDAIFLLRFIVFLLRERVDILHTHSSKAGILGRLAAIVARTPVVIHTVHGWGFHDFQPWPVRKFYALLERVLAPFTDVLIAVSRENIQRGMHEGIGRRTQYRLIRSGIDTGLYAHHSRPRAAVRRQMGIPAGAPVVGTVGNFKPQKAPLDFIAMAERVARAVPRARFVMAGDGELRPEAERLALKAGLKGKVVFTGWRRDIPDLLHSFDVFALSSLFEGLPRSVLQAHSAGLPVVATNANGTPEAVRHGVTGYIVPVRRPDLLAERVIGLLRSPSRARRMGLAGRRAIGFEFEITKMLNDIENCYLELAGLRKLV